MIYSAGLIRNLGGIGKSELYGHCLVGTKELVEAYIREVVLQIQRIAHSADPEITAGMKVDYFKDVLQGFGRTALVFHGGGASFGLCHLGVAKALFEADRLPRTICGSHIGALIAGLVCSKDEAELERVFAGDIELGPFDYAGSWQRKILRFLKHGKLFDIHILEKCARDNIGDITFKVKESASIVLFPSNGLCSSRKHSPKPVGS
jgi:predicted acylesterase/phospholipase RssA